MRRATPVTEERKSELAELAANGVSAHMAAKKMGIAKSYAYRLLGRDQARSGTAGGMSKAGILAALKTGPKTTEQLLRVTGTCSADISRDCAGLRHDGLVKRVDGGSGRGSRAVYALVEDAVTTLAPPARPRRVGLDLASANHPPIPDELVHRDPCVKCGVRADIGCKHQSKAA